MSCIGSLITSLSCPHAGFITHCRVWESLLGVSIHGITKHEELFGEIAMRDGMLCTA